MDLSKRKNSIMSYQLKEQVAQKFEEVSSRDRDNMVKMAIALAERNEKNMT